MYLNLNLEGGVDVSIFVIKKIYIHEKLIVSSLRLPLHNPLDKLNLKQFFSDYLP